MEPFCLKTMFCGQKEVDVTGGWPLKSDGPNRGIKLIEFMKEKDWGYFVWP